MAGFASPYFLTFRQAQALGGCVRKGEHGLPVIFYKQLERDAGTDEQGERTTTRIPMLRYYTVFNVEQCDGLAMPEAPQAPAVTIEPISACEQLVEAMPHRPTITHGVARAYYRPATDVVNMPAKELFSESAEYYSTLYHELVHATGHESRLNRPTLTEASHFGDANYSKEELVAEMGATFLCGITGIENRTITNSAAYIASWMRRLRDDRKLLIQAGSAAQRAVDFITNARRDLPAESPAATAEVVA